jgi:hypothetical protein
MYGLLAPVRRELLRDPLGAFRMVMDTAPPTDRAIMDDPDWQRVLIEDQREALRPGAEGWADEAMAVCSVRGTSIHPPCCAALHGGTASTMPTRRSPPCSAS